MIRLICQALAVLGASLAGSCYAPSVSHDVRFPVADVNGHSASLHRERFLALRLGDRPDPAVVYLIRSAPPQNGGREVAVALWGDGTVVTNANRHHGSAGERWHSYSGRRWKISRDLVSRLQDAAFILADAGGWERDAEAYHSMDWGLEPDLMIGIRDSVIEESWQVAIVAEVTEVGHRPAPRFRKAVGAAPLGRVDTLRLVVAMLSELVDCTSQWGQYEEATIQVRYE